MPGSELRGWVAREGPERPAVREEPASPDVPAAHAGDVRALIAAVRAVHVAQQVRQYIIEIIAATRTAPALRLGASPRAALHLLRASRAYAALEDRSFVIPDDVQELAGPVLAHRLLPTAEAVVSREQPEQVLAKIIERMPLPGR